MGFEAERSKRNTLDCLMSERYFEPSAIDATLKSQTKAKLVETILKFRFDR